MKTPLLLACVLAGAPACSKVERAPVPVTAPFVEATYEEALERARRDGRIVLLDFTASWCPPCKAMEETTWPDASVQEWIAREAVALKVDTDVQFQLAAQFGVNGIPAIVFVSAEGRELGRFVGYRDPAGFLEAARLHAP